MWTHPLVPSGMMMWARVELLKETPRSVEQLMRMCMDELNPAVQSAFPAAAIRNPAVALIHSLHKSHTGLQGVDIGSFMMKQLLLNLKQAHPYLQRFVTMSPIPGFRRWLSSELSGVSDSPAVLAAFQNLTSEEQIALLEAAPGGDSGRKSAGAAMSWLLKRPNWWTADGISCPPIAAKAGMQLVHQCCRTYLQCTVVDKKSGRPRHVDPVANFHLRNGASIGLIIRDPEKEETTMRPSYGLQVQYEYVVDQIDSNNQDYVDYGIIQMSAALKSNWQLETIDHSSPLHPPVKPALIKLAAVKPIIVKPAPIPKPAVITTERIQSIQHTFETAQPEPEPELEPEPEAAKPKAKAKPRTKPRTKPRVKPSNKGKAKPATESAQQTLSNKDEAARILSLLRDSKGTSGA